MVAASCLTTLGACMTIGGENERSASSSSAVRSSSPEAALTIGRDVDRLLGLSPEQVLDVLGPSTFTRRDGPAEIWRYATDDCFLTLFLHRGDKPRGSALTVQHFESSPRSRAGAAWVNARTCYGQLLDARGIRVGGG